MSNASVGYPFPLTASLLNVSSDITINSCSNGVIIDNGTSVNINTSGAIVNSSINHNVSWSDINNGLLFFVASRSGSSVIGYSVGASNYTITVNVNPTLYCSVDYPHVISATLLNIDNAAVTINSYSSGTLTDNGVSVSNGQVIVWNDIDNKLLSYSPTSAGHSTINYTVGLSSYTLDIYTASVATTSNYLVCGVNGGYGAWYSPRPTDFNITSGQYVQLATQSQSVSRGIQASANDTTTPIGSIFSYSYLSSNSYGSLFGYINEWNTDPPWSQGWDYFYYIIYSSGVPNGVVCKLNLCYLTVWSPSANPALGYDIGELNPLNTTTLNLSSNVNQLVKITTAPAHGIILNNGVPVGLNDTIPYANIVNNLVTYSGTSSSGSNPDVIRFIVEDTTTGADNSTRTLNYYVKSPTAYYVDPVNGNDSWSGTLSSPNGSGDGPFLTVPGTFHNSTLLKPGDIVYCLSGHHFISEFSIPDAGVAGFPITYKNFDGATPIWTPGVLASAIPMSIFGSSYSVEGCFSWTYNSENNWWTANIPNVTPPAINNVWAAWSNIAGSSTNLIGVVENGWACTQIARSAYVSAVSNNCSPTISLSYQSDPLHLVNVRFIHQGYYNQGVDSPFGNMQYFTCLGHQVMQPSWYLYQYPTASNGSTWEWRLSSCLSSSYSINSMYSGTWNAPSQPDYWTNHSTTLNGVYTGVGGNTGTITVVGDELSAMPAAFIDHTKITTGYAGIAATGPGPVVPYLYNSDNQLVFDLTYYDFTNHIIYFKSNEVSPVTNPNDPNSGVFIAGSRLVNDINDYVIFDGIKFHHGVCIVAGNNTIVRNCEFKSMTGNGCSGNNYIIENNLIDFCGGNLTYCNGGAQIYGWFNGWSHGIYFGATNNAIIRNNFFGRERSGYSIQMWTGDMTNTYWYDNIIYAGSIFNNMGVGLLINGQGNVLFNNILIALSDEWRINNDGVGFIVGDVGIALNLYVGENDHFNVFNNFIESMVWVDDCTNLSFTNNVIKNIFGLSFGNNLTSVMDYNRWVAASADDFPADIYLTDDWNTYSPFHTYWTSKGQEEHSIFSPNDVRLQSNVEGPFLETNPSLATIQSRYLTYVTSDVYSDLFSYTPYNLAYDTHPLTIGEDTFYFMGGTATVTLEDYGVISLTMNGDTVEWNGEPIYPSTFSAGVFSVTYSGLDTLTSGHKFTTTYEGNNNGPIEPDTNPPDTNPQTNTSVISYTSPTQNVVSYYCGSLSDNVTMIQIMDAWIPAITVCNNPWLLYRS